MGKFSDALRKSGDQASAESLPRKAVRTREEVFNEMPVQGKALHDVEEDRSESPGPVAPQLAGFLDQTSPAAEAFKLLRAKLLTKDSESRPRTIMITSPQPFDGKTTVAANLAINIAQGINEYVILVDCDLRRPALTKLLGLKESIGIREYLEDGTSVGLYLRKTSIKKLTLLSAGKPTSNPSAILSSNKMRELVEELRSRYEDRYIILDTTPAQFASEVTFLSSMVDAVLLVVRAGKTGKDLLMSAIENIDRDKLLGVVFNASNESHKDYRYYYHYYKKPR